MTADRTFGIEVASDLNPQATLVVGVSQIGMSGITAADYLVRHLDTERIGHSAPAELPAIAPFEMGEPRHHTRLYNVIDSELSILVGELFIPVWAARAFTDALVDWCSAEGVEEIALLHGVPFPHGPEEHAVFHVSTPAYREARLSDSDIQPLGGGLLDGVAGEIVTRSLDASSPPVGVYVTPVHPPGPDIEATLRLLDALQRVYDFEVDEAELREISAQMRRYYDELANSMQAIGDADAPMARRDFPEDRMYM